MATADTEYQQVVSEILTNGTIKNSRCGPVRSYVGLQFRYDLRKGFPLLQHKKLSFYNIAVELQWFLKGRTDVKFLQDKNVHIWDKDAANSWRDDGGLGPVYGHQWRNAHGRHDQIKDLIGKIKANPYDRRLIVSAWNVDEIGLMVLPPCHYAFQIVAQSEPEKDLVLGIVVTMRSTDVGLGLPYNIASYALLLNLIANTVGAKAGVMVVNMADAHVYEPHIDPLWSRLDTFHSKGGVMLNLTPEHDLEWFENEDLTPLLVNSMLRNYEPAPKLNLPLLVGPPSNEPSAQSANQSEIDPDETKTLEEAS